MKITIELTQPELESLIKFMRRTELRGYEVPEFSFLMARLAMRTKSESPDTPKPTKQASEL